MSVRVGQGFDIHRFSDDADRRLVLGGVVFDGARAIPRLLFIDTGCGIAPSQLPLVFERFYSYPPSSGSGIGLALCKEIMGAWSANIRLTSRENGYTMFVLEFPRIRLAEPVPALAA